MAHNSSFTLDEKKDGCPDIHCLRTSVHSIADDGSSVIFSDGTRKEYDVILFATGYKQRFPFLHPHIISNGDHGRPKNENHDDALPNEHNICSTDEPSIGYFGFVRPNVGAIPPMSELQVMWWIQRLRGDIAGFEL